MSDSWIFLFGVSSIESLNTRYPILDTQSLVGSMETSSILTRGGMAATSTATAATSSGWSIFTRASCGGGVGRRAHGRPLRLRRGAEPLARGLPHLRAGLGGARSADGRDDRDPARPHARRLLRIPRQALRPPGGEDLPGSQPADSDPDRRPRRARAAPRGPHRRRLDARGRRRRGWASSATRTSACFAAAQPGSPPRRRSANS